MSIDNIVGWIKLWRKMWNSPHSCKRGYICVWVWLLTHATHEGQIGENTRYAFFKGKKITLEVGQLVCGSKQISRETGVPESTVRRHLRCMQSEHQIERQSDNRCSLITIVNWNKYQGSERQDGQQVSDKRSSYDDQVNTNRENKNIKKKEFKKDLSDAEASDSPVTTNVIKSDFQNAQYLAEMVVESNPANKQKYGSVEHNEIQRKISLWVEDIEKMRRLDNAKPEQIKFVLEWLRHGNTRDANFWRGNIASGRKLRAQFPKLVSCIQREHETKEQSIVAEI